MAYALDLGTTNSLLCRWDAAEQRPRIVHLPGISRLEDTADELLAPRAVPSALHFVEQPDLWARASRLPMLRRHFLWGREAWIGREALERNHAIAAPAFVPTFKTFLQHAATRPVARVAGETRSARDALRIFLRELVAANKSVTGERIRAISVTTPVDAYEAYRAEVRAALNDVGVDEVTFHDEPVAAAAGYGLSLSAERRVLVIDFGAGTLNAALVMLTPREAAAGRCAVIGKAGRSVGGNLVDEFLLAHILERLETQIPDDPFWKRLLLDDARTVKESLFLRESASFLLRPPNADLRARIAIARGKDHTDVTRSDLVAVLEKRGVYTAIREAIDEACSEEPDEVLMVGGSTLLPGVWSVAEQRFGRERVRAWQPFEAVAFGGCALAAGAVGSVDHLVHDYAILVHTADGEPAHEVIVPRGTKFPTPGPIWRRSLVPTCAHGEPETTFRLVIGEVGRSVHGERSFGWDESGSLMRLDDGNKQFVALNASDPVLGRLDPPHRPSDRSARLDVAFSVDADRFLSVNVSDLHSGASLLRQSRVLRLV